MKIILNKHDIQETTTSKNTSTSTRLIMLSEINSLNLQKKSMFEKKKIYTIDKYN